MTSPEHVSVKPGLRFPATLTATWTPRVSQLSYTSTDIYDAVFTGTWNSERIAYDLTELTIRQRADGGPAITGERIRDFKVHEVFRGAVRKFVTDDMGEAVGELDAPRDIPSRRLREHDGLLLVAQTYAIARACGDPPLKTVADTFHISQSTATRLAALAREQGLLD